MPDIPRLNGVIKALEQGKTAFVGFASPDIETATALASSPFDGVAFEMEHAPMSPPVLRDALQYMQQQKVERIFHAAALYDPPGIRGDAPTRAARYWGLTQPEYYARADVWPLAPQGEILAIIQCEDTKAIENLPRILEQVRGIGVVLIGEGDLSQELGHPREYEHPVVAEAIDRILKICKDHNVPCGHPHPDAKNIERLIASGYRFLMPSTPRSFGVLEQGRKLAGRS